MKIPKVIFVRIGYMHHYAGQQEGDEKPQHGGAYNKKGVGHEECNFKKIKRSFYGYVQPYELPKDSTSKVTINLNRIDPKVQTASLIRNALVIFVARSNDQGQVVVGWYKNATVYRYYQNADLIDERYLDYNLKANTSNATLLPIKYRSHLIPSGKKGAFGRANIVYLTNIDKSAREFSEEKYSWMEKAINFVNRYSGPNLVTDPTYDAESDIENIYDSTQIANSGQGFKLDPKLRKQIENYSVDKAIQYFKKQKYKVEDVGKYKSYDLECKKGATILHVEVKGTQTEGKSIILTKNEVANAKKYLTALFILHSIKVEKKRNKYYLSEGKSKTLNPWNINEFGKLTALSFSYKLK